MTGLQLIAAAAVLMMIVQTGDRAPEFDVPATMVALFLIIAGVVAALVGAIT